MAWLPLKLTGYTSPAPNFMVGFRKDSGVAVSTEATAGIIATEWPVSSNSFAAVDHCNRSKLSVLPGTVDHLDYATTVPHNFVSRGWLSSAGTHAL